MNSSLAGLGKNLQTLWEDGERVFCRGWCDAGDSQLTAVLVVVPTSKPPTPGSLDRLAHEFGLKDELDSAWAVRPLELRHERGRTMLILEDADGQPLEGLLGAPMEMGRFLRLAIGIVTALGKAHRRGIIHKDLKPANILVNPASGEVRLTGFGIASRLLRERQAPEPPEFIAGTLAYMAPEQTGRMNRSIDSRADLYALGVTMYQMLTGALPFTASDPMEWVHCHIARKPVPPSERLENVPAPVSAIIMKLLAKTAEERYQTTGGLENDLRRCLTEWRARRQIDDFPLGPRDIHDRLLIPEKLYGRAREVDILLACFDRIIKSGAPELVLVSGYSGIGKSSVVNELHKELVPQRGLFAAGKFDQYKRDIPYSTLAQAFQSLVRSLLGMSDTELSAWRTALLEALGPNGRLMTDLVPELKLIIGEQLPFPELAPQDAQRRFRMVLQHFIGVFARPEHPLALFLDDLQWLDAATLDLLEDLLTRSDLQHLMLVGAYRENEVTASHPLMRKLEAIKSAGRKIAEVTLAPLAEEHLRELLADAFRCEPERAKPLAQLVHQKTGGNPFFAIQFISSLAEEKFLTFDHDSARWIWELERIHDKGYTENVVDLMVGKLTRLPAKTQDALEQLACLGNVAEITLLSIVLGIPEQQVYATLWPAVRQELVERLAGTYRFIHDRIQEAAYSLIPAAARAETHLRIGRLLAAHIAPEKREEAIFDVVNQLNRGAALITSREESEQLAELNLLAGKRAKASSAYASALKYLVNGAAVLPGDCWERRHEIAFELELHRAECEFVTGALAEAEQRLTALSTLSANTTERASVDCLRVDLYTTLGQTSRAVAVGLDYLRHLGVQWSPHPTDEDVRREFDRVWSLVTNRTLEDVIALPLMTDPAYLAAMDVLAKIGPPALFREPNLYVLAVCLAVNLSLERGNSDGSCDAYVRLGVIAGERLDDYKAGFRCGEIGYKLVERRGLKRFQARTYLFFGTQLMPFTRHIRAGRDLLRRGFEIASKVGDLTFAGWYRCFYLTENLIGAGDPLVEVHREAEQGLSFAQKARSTLLTDFITGHIGLVRTLRGLTSEFGSFDDGQFDELRTERRFAADPDLARPAWSYWVRKLQARCLACDYPAAVEASSRAKSLLPPSLTPLEAAEYHFYAALSHAACCDSVPAGQSRHHLDAVVAHHRRLQILAESCPENFENRAALVGAEIARIECRDVDAMRLYEQAIRSARANGFVHNEALAYELAARSYGGRGFEDFARLYLRNARDGYLRWGATAKVRQLELRYPQILEDPTPLASAAVFGTPLEQLDIGAVVKASQAVSGEIVLDQLSKTLMTIALEHAGAERGLLILRRGDTLQIEAEARTDNKAVEVTLRREPVTAAALPESLLRTVCRTRQSLILDDASAPDAFPVDEYIRLGRVRSVLCLPLMKQAELVGALYLENNLTPCAFTTTRITVLELLASQAAISLENARLYNDLREREARIRRLVDSNIVGIMIWDIQGQIIEANDAFLRIVGHCREDLTSGRLRWMDLTPAEWLDRDERQRMPELRVTGILQPFEKEYIRKDGSRVPVLIGLATFEETGKQGVAFVLDLTERKQAEEALREAQTNLAHVARVATLGELTASIAHEVNQPISGIVINGNACLRWLAGDPPNLEEAREAARRIVRDGKRAGDVIARIRALATKTTTEKAPLDINEAIEEVARSGAERNEQKRRDPTHGIGG